MTESLCVELDEVGAELPWVVLDSVVEDTLGLARDDGAVEVLCDGGVVVKVEDCCDEVAETETEDVERDDDVGVEDDTGVEDGDGVEDAAVELDDDVLTTTDELFKVVELEVEETAVDVACTEVEAGLVEDALAEVTLAEVLALRFSTLTPPWCGGIKAPAGVEARSEAKTDGLPATSAKPPGAARVSPRTRGDSSRVAATRTMSDLVKCITPE